MQITIKQSTYQNMDKVHLFNWFLFLLSSNLLTFFLTSTSNSFSSPFPPRKILFVSSTSQNNSNNTTYHYDQNNNNEDYISLGFTREFMASASAQRLPLGYSPKFESDTIYPALGQACTKFKDKLNKYMTYEVNGSCPDDEVLAQKLLLKGCEPLPRRRCRPAAPVDAAEPLPSPDSLWSIPPDGTVVWTAYTCKNYTCLVNRRKWQKAFDDCKDCFDLEGREKIRWTEKAETGRLDFTIDEVLASTTRGTIRIGLDIGGGSGTFAVRMKEKNVTMVTTSMNFNGPFNNFIASRGVIPLYMSISQRLPFFDNTLDIVHSMHVLANWIPVTQIHFVLFDIYRVLRPGGLFWLDHFFCTEDQFDEVYKPIIESVGFDKLKWVVGKKVDRAPELKELYLSALLQKPLKNSW